MIDKKRSSLGNAAIGRLKKQKPKNSGREGFRKEGGDVSVI